MIECGSGPFWWLSFRGTEAAGHRPAAAVEPAGGVVIVDGPVLYLIGLLLFRAVVDRALPVGPLVG